MQRTVLLGVTGCIAAYKSCEIVRGLQKADLHVKVVMTESATRFVGPVTFRALTKEPVAIGLFDDGPGDPIHHISLAKEADLFLIAPCTANGIAKIAHGIADDLLTTTALATQAPIMIAPAMNSAMFENPITQENMRTLLSRGVKFIDAESGYLACGDVGKGRLADPQIIVDAVVSALSIEGPLAGKRVLITAGPTIEPLDPARFISNRSSGKMGYALAQRAAALGGKVTLVSGLVALDAPEGVDVVSVETAEEMLAAASEAFPRSNIAIFSAAVCDGRPASYSPSKLKKSRDEALAPVELVENPDILATLAAKRAPGQVIVGFAAETDDLEGNGKAKLAAKGADIIVANPIDGGRTFGDDQSQALLITADGVESQPAMTKAALADVILRKALDLEQA